MTAAQVVEHGKPLVIRDIPVPTPGDGELLVRLEVTGVCHTDVHVQEGDWKVKSPLPMTPGHEGVGIVVATGPGGGPLSRRIPVGERVTVPWLHSSCGQCEHCWAGWETVCASQRRTGFSFHGTFAQYCIVDAAFAVPVPSGLEPEQAAVISCAGVTVYKGLKVSDVNPGQWVVIVGGSGNLGHLAIQYAKCMGMRVVGVDVGQSKVDFMTSLGADKVVDSSKDDIVSKVKEYTNGGAHGALIIAPVARLVSEAVKYMRPRGTVVAIGLPSGTFEGDIFDIVLNAITIRGSIVGTRLDLLEALNLAIDGKVVCRIQKRQFNELQNVLNDLKGGKIQGCVAVDIP